MTDSRTRRRRVLAHQCPHCRQLWALRAVVAETGPVIACRFCAAVRWAPAVRTHRDGTG